MDFDNVGTDRVVVKKSLKFFKTGLFTAKFDERSVATILIFEMSHNETAPICLWHAFHLLPEEWLVRWRFI